ncbi:hypothetical protein HNQ91_002656 [Filimonas zeae]|uniref:Beta-glucosidase n=1 Tax=Filimonas zeae TaxID=1737353 RepID=A0A917MX94_9BACT|nr:amine oxidase [Filimonas zeae]MDR6339605.1 hypothetical protein [Filimonas zeae]GGH74249.1 beta-glucosidase [Filimonas zeae]
MHNPFQSFWMAGFECTDQLNAFGNRVDFLHITGHLEKLDEDYQNLKQFEIRTIREGIRWSQVETHPYQYNFASVRNMVESAAAHNIQVIWDLCHFGYPDDLTPLHPHFTARFCALCQAFVAFYRLIQPTGTLIVTPINEVGFISWLGGDVAGTSPYCRHNGWEVKYELMRAYIQGVETLRQCDPNIRILTTEPLINIVPPPDATDEQQQRAQLQHEAQFQVTDILCGRMCPELGGRSDYLDMLGLNFYYNNQWVSDSFEPISWLNRDTDNRWLPLSSLLTAAYARYQRPLVLSETSHPEEDRPQWITFIATECNKILQHEIPLWGICWYPAIDRPDWDHLTPWHRSGLWDIPDPATQNRVLHTPSATALANAQRWL